MEIYQIHWPPTGTNNLKRENSLKMIDTELPEIKRDSPPVFEIDEPSNANVSAIKNNAFKQAILLPPPKSL